MLGEPFNQTPSSRQLRFFGASLFTGFLVLGILFWLRFVLAASGSGANGSSYRAVALGCWLIGTLAGVLPWISIPSATLLYRCWMTMAAAISRVMIPVGLTVIFVVLLPWFAFIRFADPLRKRLRGQPTYWETPRNPDPTLDRTLRPF